MKIKKYSLVILIILVLGAVTYFGSNLLSLAGYDDFLIEDDFSVPSPALIQSNFCSLTAVAGYSYPLMICQDNRWKTTRFNCGDQVPSSRIENEKLILKVIGDGRITSEYLVDLKDNDIKTTLKLDTYYNQIYYSSSGTFTLYLDGTKIYSDSVSYIYKSLSTSSKEFLIEIIKDIEIRDLVHVIINGKTVSSKLILSSTANLIFELQGSGGCGANDYPPISELTIDFIKSRPYYNCQADTDEVVIRDRFGEGSTFNFKTLTYKPTSFCPDTRPIVKYDLATGAERKDYFGSLFNKLVSNKDIIVPTGTYIEVEYYTDYKEGMGERCNAVTEYYSTKTKTCIKFAKEEEDIIQLPPSKEFIQVGIEDISFIDSIRVADKTLTLSAPEYLCAEQDDKAYAPNPRAECWQVNIDGTTLIYGEKTQIHPFYEVEWIPTAMFKDGEVETDYVNNAILRLKNADKILEITPKDTSDYYTLFGSDKKIDLTLKNNLGSFEESGFKITQTKHLLTSQKVITEIKPFKGGSQDYSLHIDTNTYGKQTYEIVAYYKIGDKTIYDNERVIREIEVVDAIPTDVQVIEKTITIEKIVEIKPTFADFLKEIWEWVLNLFR